MTATRDTDREPQAQGAPIVVRVDPRTIKVATTILGFVSAFAASLVVLLPDVGPAGQRYTMLHRLAYVGGWLGFFLLCRISGRRSHVALYPDRVEVTVALMPTRRIARADVVARSTKPGRWRPIPVLVLKNGRRITMPVYLESNREFSGWLNTLPRRPRRRWLGR